MTDQTNQVATEQPSDPGDCSAVRLYEITALVSYSAVVAAVSREDALEAVKSWENAWHDSADLVGVSDIEVSDVRDRTADDIDDEAHAVTEAAMALMPVEADE
jgi:hypothetical protein